MGWTGGGGAVPPVFGASGPSHSTGLVPDPGATAGSTRFLREDTSWVVPSGTGGGMSIGGAITSGTANSVLYVGAGGVLAQDNAALAWNDGLDTLTVGNLSNNFSSLLIQNALANTFIGYQTGHSIATGGSNVALGTQIMQALTTGSQNMGIGAFALNGVTTGSNNVAVGAGALQGVSASSENIGIGEDAYQSGDGGAVTAIGYQSFKSSLGSNSVAIGAFAGFSYTGSGTQNNFLGYGAGYSVTSGNYNTIVGSWNGPSGAMSSVIALSDGAGNLRADYGWTAVGWTLKLGSYLELYLDDMTTHYNCFVGGAGSTNATANGAIGNVAVGSFSLSSTSLSGAYNLAVGSSSLAATTVGGGNVAVGENSLAVLTGSTASQNTAIGQNTAPAMTNGQYNVYIGVNAGLKITAGFSNTIIGGSALAGLAAAGNNNTAVGNSAGSSLTTISSNNTLLGTWGGPSGGMSNVIAISDGNYGASPQLDYNYTTSGSWSLIKGAGLVFQGSTSGAVTISVAAAAGTWNMQLPANAGTSGYVLQTNGSGVTSWVPTGTATIAIGSAITGGTANSVLYVNASNQLAQDNAAFSWTDSSKTLLGGSVFQMLANSVAVNALFPIYNSSGDNWFVGESGNTSVTGSQNFGLGRLSLFAITSGTGNVAVGYTALSAATTGNSNVALGSFAFQHLNDSQSIAIGGSAANGITAGNASVYIGGAALYNATGTANNDTMIGGFAGFSLTSSGNNTLVGTTSGYNVTSGTNNTLVGGWRGPSGAMSSVIALSDGAGNLELDYNYSLAGTWNFGANINMGLKAIEFGPTLSGQDTSIFRDGSAGSLALYTGVTGGGSFRVYNTYSGSNWERGIFDWQNTSNVLTLGSQANGTGTIRDVQMIASTPFLYWQYSLGNLSLGNGKMGTSGAGVTGSANICMGTYGFPFLTSGNVNLGIGQQCMLQLSTGSGNVGIGNQALDNVSTGGYNVGIGYQAGVLGNYAYTVLIGNQCNGNAAHGGYSVQVGHGAGYNLAGGSTNTLVGYQAGAAITSGNNNTFLGAWQGPSGALSNVIALSDGAGNLLADYGYTGSGTWTFQGNIYTPHSVYLSTGSYVSYGSGAAIPAVGYEASPGGVAIFDSGTLSNPVVFTVYNNATANWERGIFGWLSNTLTIGSQSTGTGVGRSVAFQAGGNLNNVAPGLINVNTSFTGSTPGAALTSISNATPAVFTLTNHGLFGGQPILLTTTGTLPAPLAINTTYFVDSASLASGTFEVSTTYGGAVVNTTTAGSGTHTFTPGGVCTISIGANSTVTFNNHGMVPGQAFKFATTGALPTGITAGTTYYVIPSSMTINAFRYSATPNGATITTSGTQSGTQTLTLDSATQNQTNTVLALGVSAILNGSISAGHRFTQYWNTTGTPLGALIVNAVNLNSASGGKIFDAQLSGTSYFSVQNVSGNAALVPASSFSLSPGGTSKLDYGITTSSVWSFLAELDLIAGTTTVAPMKFKSGTNLTTAAAGALEFDGKCFYETAVASSRQVSVTEQFQILTAARTFTNNTSAQAIFNATANGAITLAGTTTYAFEMVVAASGFSASSHTINLGFGGTATLTSMSYYYEAQAGSTLAGPNADSSGFMASATAAAIIASSTTTGLVLYVRGTIQVNAGGTFIPQLTQVTASAAAVVQIGSFFRAWPLGLNTVTNVGNWS